VDYFKRTRVGTVGTVQSRPPLPNEKGAGFLIGNRRFFEYACLILVDFPQLPSVASYGTKVVLYRNAAQDQGIDT